MKETLQIIQIEEFNINYKILKIFLNLEKYKYFFIYLLGSLK
jgi:hypothetical protein